jgi:hypothetical protein
VGAARQFLVLMFVFRFIVYRPVPDTIWEAFNGPDSPQWQGALQEELQSLIDNNVYEVVPMPVGVIVICGT